MAQEASNAPGARWGWTRWTSRVRQEVGGRPALSKASVSLSECLGWEWRVRDDGPGVRRW
jgi:hypothetical protein